MSCAITFIVVAIVSAVPVTIYFILKRRERDEELAYEEHRAELEAASLLKSRGSWYRVTVTPEVRVKGGAILISQAFIELTGKAAPGEALFLSNQTEPTILYFSPAAAIAGAVLINVYHGEACVAPSREIVEYFIGDRKVEELLPQ